MTVESVSPRQNSEIIIAVPTVSSTNERKTVSSKRAAIISFEEEENAFLTNNNVLKSSTPPRAVSLAHACLKYQEKQKLANEKAKPFVSDSTYERLHAEPISIANTVHPKETEYIRPESPTAIKIITPVTQTYQSSHTASLSNSYDYKETDSSMSKATDSSSIASNTTTHSSNSVPNQEATSQSQPSQSNSMSSSISSAHNSVPNSPTEEDPTSTENELISRIEELTTVENEHVHRIQELEKRCATLEQQVTTLTL